MEIWKKKTKYLKDRFRIKMSNTRNSRRRKRNLLWKGSNKATKTDHFSKSKKDQGLQNR